MHAPAEPASPLTILFCSHGGSYTRRYWDFELEGYPGYSFAQAMTAHGFVVVAWDELCTGESSCPDDPWAITSVEVAAAVDDLVRQVRDRVAAGTLAPQLPPADDPVTIGVGHSLGGLLTVRRQGRHRSHDAVAILGWTNIGLTFGPGWQDTVIAPLLAALPDASPTELEQSIRGLRDRLEATPVSAHRTASRSVFHWPDVPAEVLAADDKLASARQGTTRFIGRIPGVVRDDAALIDVPLLLGFGERDVSPDPRAEAAAYSSCGDITFHLLPTSGHCHNFASTRAAQWERIATWVETVAAR